MFKNANIVYEIKNSKRRRYYAKFQDLALKRRREIFYEMDPWFCKRWDPVTSVTGGASYFNIRLTDFTIVGFSEYKLKK